jgi:ABC transporter transmembrane region
MTVIFGNLTNVFGGLGSPNSPTVASISSVEDFNHQVTHFALQFVYLGIGVLVASFLGTFFWTLSGERVSRRIRGYCFWYFMLTVDYTCKLFFVKMLLFLIDLVQEK